MNFYLTFFVFFIPTPLSLSNNASSTIGPKNSCKYSSVNSPFMLVNVFLTALFLINLSSTLEVILFVEFQLYRNLYITWNVLNVA